MGCAPWSVWRVLTFHSREGFDVGFPCLRARVLLQFAFLRLAPPPTRVRLAGGGPYLLVFGPSKTDCGGGGGGGVGGSVERGYRGFCSRPRLEILLLRRLQFVRGPVISWKRRATVGVADFGQNIPD